MRSRYINYGDIDNEIEEWKRRTQFYQNIEFKICSVPLFRRYYLVKFKSGEEIASAHNYYYMDQEYFAQNNKRVLTSNMQEFQTYKAEFEYLWEGNNDGEKISFPYSQFRKYHTDPIPELDYVLIYKTSNEHRVDPYIISRLRISTKGIAKLETNYIDSENRYEYKYHGTATLKGSNVYVSLMDAFFHETVYLNLKRSVPSINRCIGMLRGLTPSNHPLCSLCLCVPFDQFEKMKYTDIDKIFDMYGDNNSLIITETMQDYFFSLV